MRLRNEWSIGALAPRGLALTLGAAAVLGVAMLPAPSASAWQQPLGKGPVGIAPAPARGRNARQGGVPLKKLEPPNAVDPLGKVPGLPAAGAAGANAKANAKANANVETYHIDFRLRAFDGASLAASYYRSKLGPSAPVLLLVHESGRSRRDFEDPVLELNGEGLAEHLQSLNFAVLAIDLRGQGQNPRRVLVARDRPRLVEDLQAAYYFLVDRHNRGELNLAKFGVVGMGDGANLAAAWAVQPGAGVTIQGRPSDITALVLISPMPEGSGFVLRHVLTALAPRVPMLLMGGENDHASHDAIQASRARVERLRLNKIELYPSALHGYKMLRLEPKVTSDLFKFLNTTLKGRAVDWEPEYNLMPVAVADPRVVKHKKRERPAPKAPAPAPAPAPPPAPGENAKAKDRENADAPDNQKEKEKDQGKKGDDKGKDKALEKALVPK